MEKSKMITTKKIGIIGTGNMGGAIIGGLLNAHITVPQNLFAFDVKESQISELLARYKFNKCASNIEVVERAEFIILAVKPQNMREVLTEIKPAVKKHHCFLSIAAGIRTEFIENILGEKTRVVRAMPNTPALIGAGATAIAPGSYAEQIDIELAEKIFSALGIAVQVDEKQLDAVTALSGSGPAYFFYLIESMIKAGIKLGIPDEIAEELVKQTAIGSARLAAESIESPAELRKKVTSPGGTTEAAMEVFLKYKFKDIVIAAIQRATQRAQELSQKS